MPRQKRFSVSRKVGDAQTAGRKNEDELERQHKVRNSRNAKPKGPLSGGFRFLFIGGDTPRAW